MRIKKLCHNVCASNSFSDLSLYIVCILFIYIDIFIIDISANNGQNGPMFQKETNRLTRDK